MLDFTKLFKIKIESEKDFPQAIRLILESVPDNLLIRLWAKSRAEKLENLTPYLEEEIDKRGSDFLKSNEDLNSVDPKLN